MSILTEEQAIHPLNIKHITVQLLESLPLKGMYVDGDMITKAGIK